MEIPAKTPILRELSRKKWLILLFVLGISLLLIGSIQKKDEKSDTAVTDVSAYKSELTKEVTSLCRSVTGVGNITVLLYFPSAEEYVYAENSTGSGESYVTHSGDGLLLRVDLPRPAGVAVVCTGGNDPVVKEALTGLLSSLLGLGSNRIAVTAGNPQ